MVARYESQFGFWATPELRLEVVANRRYRIPDILLMPRGSETSGPLRTTPLSIFEIWSPDDRLPHQTERYYEFWNKGVRHIIILDPETRRSWRWVENALIEGPVNDLNLPDGGSIPFSSAAVFQQLDEMLNTAPGHQG